MTSHDCREQLIVGFDYLKAWSHYRIDDLSLFIH